MAVLIERYKGQSKAPDVALIGSSLMRRPFHACDEIELGSTDYSNYCQAKALAQSLSLGRPKVDVFNVARDGAMVSDALLTERHLLRGSLRPKVLVYGVAPRDFIDSLLVNERATDTFRCLFSLDDALTIGECFTTNPKEEFELIAQETLPLYACRQGIQTKTAKIARAMYGREVSACDYGTSGMFDSPARDYARCQQLFLASRGNAKDKLAVEASQRNAVEIISKASKETKDWRYSLFQYNMNYFLIDQRRFDRQENALSKLLELAKARHIEVLVVNMPLAPANLDLMPPGFYTQYQERVSKLCSKHHASFLDLQTDKSFTHSNFGDVAHLNASGGKILIERITPPILNLLQVSKGNEEKI
jgi:hypothetical protein